MKGEKRLKETILPVHNTISNIFILIYLFNMFTPPLIYGHLNLVINCTELFNIVMN